MANMDNTERMRKLLNSIDSKQQLNEARQLDEISDEVVNRTTDARLDAVKSADRSNRDELMSKYDKFSKNQRLSAKRDVRQQKAGKKPDPRSLEYQNAEPGRRNFGDSVELDESSDMVEVRVEGQPRNSKALLAKFGAQVSSVSDKSVYVMVPEKNVFPFFRAIDDAGCYAELVDDYFSESQLNEKVELDEKAKSKAQQRFMGMVHSAQQGEKPASKEVADVAKSMKKSDAEDFAATKHKGLPEKVTDECTTSAGSVAPMATPFAKKTEESAPADKDGAKAPTLPLLGDGKYDYGSHAGIYESDELARIKKIAGL